MKKPWVLVLLLLSICIGGIVLKSSHIELDDDDEDEEKEAGIEKDMMFWFQSRAYPDPYFLDDKYARAWQQALKLKEKNTWAYTRVEAANWVQLGPKTGIGGRILSIAINPVKTSSIFIGSASGGIWKTYNSGTDWMPVVTNTQLLGVSSVIINPADTMVLYAGTGEVYRNDTTGATPNPGNAGYNVWKARGTYGVGILKSTDGGYNWTQVFTKSLPNMFGVQRLRFDPTNTSIVYACTTDGLYKTTDDGASWARILDQTYVSDVVINAKNPAQVVVAAGNFANTNKGIWRSTNGGSSWTKISAGLPASFQGFIKFDNVTSLGNRDTIIASIGIQETPAVNELYRSADFGATWAVLGSSSHSQWQYWCAHNVAINPSNSNKLIFGGVKLRTYTISTATASGTIAIHDDIHDIKFDPTNANIAYVACDGGMYRSTNAGTSFTQIDNGLAATQFFASFGVSPAGAGNNQIVGGLQDNGVVWSQDGGTTWGTYPGNYGDGAACAIDPTNGNNILASGDARNFTLSTNGGSTASANPLAYLGGAHDSRTAFVSPVAYSLRKPSVVYVGSDNLHKSVNGGVSWTNNGAFTATAPANYIDAIHKTAIAIAVSPTDPNGDTLFVSTSPFAQFDNDADGLFITGQPNILKSTNGGTTTPLTSVKGTLPDRFVMDFLMSPTYHDSMYIALGGFGTAHIYVTANGGTTWTALGTSSLPDVPFNALVFDPINPKIIYAGSDLGVYVTADRGINWVDFNSGFWDATQVLDLQIDKNNKLLAATHGKGMWRSDLFFGSFLPVTLVNFNGIGQPDNNILNWTVAQENNINHYELERSPDGVHFQSIASVNPQNAQTQANYNYKDVWVTSSPQFYYRLKMIGNDGGFTYSAVIIIKSVIVKNEVRVLQNPVHNNVLLQYSVTGSQKVKLSLMNSAGALLRKEAFTAAGTGIYNLPLAGSYPAGVYLLRIENGLKTETRRLIKE